MFATPKISVTRSVATITQKLGACVQCCFVRFLIISAKIACCIDSDKTPFKFASPVKIDINSLSDMDSNWANSNCIERKTSEVLMSLSKWSKLRSDGANGILPTYHIIFKDITYVS